MIDEMDRKPRWQPSDLIVSLMGSQGILLVLGCIPLGCMMAWQFYHNRVGDLRAAIIGGLVVTVMVGCLGFISYLLCLYFAKRQVAFDLAIARTAVHQIVDQLVHDDYESVVQRCAASRLTSTQLLEVVDSYKHKLAIPQPDAQHILTPVRVVDIRMSKWSVQVPLWTEHNGQSDLTLELTISVLSGAACVTLEDLHVR